MSIAPTTEPIQNGAGNVTVATPHINRLISHDDGQFANLMDTSKFEHLQRLATLFASSDLVPEQFRGKVANCFIGLQMALRLGIDPLMFLQSCYVVHGRPGIEAKLAVALANTSGTLRDGIHYDVTGDGASRQCEAWAIHKSGERISAVCTMKMAQDEGWAGKSGSKWKTLPDLMLKYRSAMFLIRTHIPEAILGMQSTEELEDIEPVRSYQQTQPLQAPPTSLDALAERLSPESKTVTVENQDAEPADDWSALLTDYYAELNEAKTIPAVSEIYRAWTKREGLSQDQLNQLYEASDSRKAQIKGGQ